jgi:hypothetical protein
VTVCPGGSATFTVTATGSAPIAYQWRKGGENISEATSATYTIAASEVSDAGSYDCVVGNGCGSVVSNAAALQVGSSIRIVSQPESTVLCCDERISFPGTYECLYTLELTATAEGSGELSHQWLKDGRIIPGANSSTYRKERASPEDSGQYVCRVASSATCSVDTAAAEVLVIVPQQEIQVEPPPTRVVCLGDVVEFCIEVPDPRAVDYQWLRNGLPLDGETDRCLRVVATNDGADDLGDPSDAFDFYECLYQGRTCTIFRVSWAQKYTIAETLRITAQPVAQSGCLGGAATFSVAAEGPPPLGSLSLRYQWRRDGIDIPGATQPDHVVPVVGIDDLGAAFDCVVTGFCGSIVSNMAFVDPSRPTIRITTQPRSVTYVPGGTATLEVAYAELRDPLNGRPSVRWHKRTSTGVVALSDGGRISGATTGRLVIASMNDQDRAAYFLRSTTGCPAPLDSDDAFITCRPVFTSFAGPLGGEYRVGSLVVLPASFQSGGTQAFRWIRQTPSGPAILSDGPDFAGTETSTLHILCGDESLSGVYRCEAVNTCGPTLSPAFSVWFTRSNDCRPEFRPPSGPLGGEFEPGGDVPLSATFASVSPLSSIRWLRQLATGLESLSNGLEFGGVDTSTLTILDGDESLAGTYRCEAVNSCGRSLSPPYTVTFSGGGVPCIADFNRDGGIDGEDVAMFFDAWEASDPDADANQDGGIDGGDIAEFFSLWEAGGC